MKTFFTFCSAVIFLFSVGCGSGNTDATEEYSGIIEPAGITSYQYGTHTLQSGEEFYALKSDTVNLADYEGREVTITARKIDGYPVDGGPVYLNVEEVKE